MPETQFPAVIQHMTYCQIGSDIRLFGSDPVAPGGCFRECKRIITCLSKNQKAQVVKI